MTKEQTISSEKEFDLSDQNELLANFYPEDFNKLMEARGCPVRTAPFCSRNVSYYAGMGLVGKESYCVGEKQWMKS